MSDGERGDDIPCCDWHAAEGEEPDQCIGCPGTEAVRNSSMVKWCSCKCCGRQPGEEG